MIKVNLKSLSIKVDLPEVPRVGDNIEIDGVIYVVSQVTIKTNRAHFFGYDIEVDEVIWVGD